MSAPDSIAHKLGLPYRTRKVRHKKLTAEQWQRLEREAEARALTTRNKILADELNLSELYVAHVVSRLLAERRGSVPRLAHVFALSDTSASATLTSGRTVTPARSESVAPHTPTASAPNSHEQHR